MECGLVWSTVSMVQSNVVHCECGVVDPLWVWVSVVHCELWVWCNGVHCECGVAVLKSGRLSSQQPASVKRSSNTSQLNLTICLAEFLLNSVNFTSFTWNFYSTQIRQLRGGNFKYQTHHYFVKSCVAIWGERCWKHDDSIVKYGAGASL